MTIAKRMSFEEALEALRSDVDGALPIGSQTIINRTLRVEPLRRVIEAAERYVDLQD